nr:Rieske 2Fe-2S domain-containing protein [Robbsia betulipollinis]
MNTVFGQTWTFLAHESEIPNPNDYVRKRLGLRPIVVTRAADGTLHAVLNRCTHRGATVCRHDSGNARRFTCPYHNWTFANTGELVGVPIVAGYGPGFDKGELGLGKLRVETYRGFVFGTFNQALPDLKTHLGQAAAHLDQWLDRWPGAKLVVRHGATKLRCNGNWKLVYDNSADGYHPGFSHLSLLRMRKDRYGGGVDMQWVSGDVDAGLQTVTDLGNGNTFLDQRAEITAYWPQAAPMPGENAYESTLRARLGDAGADAALDMVMGSGMNLNIFPNLLIIGNQLQVIEPFDVDHSELSWYATSLEADDLPPEITALRMRLQEDFPAFGEPDDLANFEACQEGLRIAEMEWVHTGRHLDTGREGMTPEGLPTSVVSSELPIRAFWKQWKTLMNGQPARIGAAPAGLCAGDDA